MNKSMNLLLNSQQRYFAAGAAELEVKKPEETAIDLDEQRRKIGVDMTFSEKKHAYVLTFPWNFPEIINEYESEFRPLSKSSYWHRFVNNTPNLRDFNHLYREFHQFVATNDHRGLSDICEPRLASYVSQSIKRVRFHGLSFEMANLTVVQPSIKVLKAEVYHGLNL